VQARGDLWSPPIEDSVTSIEDPGSLVSLAFNGTIGTTTIKYPIAGLR
jgi:hypothetical protein